MAGRALLGLTVDEELVIPPPEIASRADAFREFAHAFATLLFSASFQGNRSAITHRSFIDHSLRSSQPSRSSEPDNDARSPSPSPAPSRHSRRTNTSRNRSATHTSETLSRRRSCETARWFKSTTYNCYLAFVHLLPKYIHYLFYRMSLRENCTMILGTSCQKQRMTRTEKILLVQPSSQ